MIITIKYNSEYKEYNVPNLKGVADDGYFTNDKEDAINTAKKIHGEDIVIKFRSVKSKEV